MNKKKLIFFWAFSLISFGCFHDEELRKEVFNVNTRVLTLENELQDKQQMNSRQYVSASSRVTQMQEDLQKIRGEIDRLQIGVQKGEMPGANENEPSVAKQLAALTEALKNIESENLAKLDERMKALEKTQVEMLGILEKLDHKKKANKSEKKSKLNSLKAIEQAFHHKHFKDIVEDAPHLLSAKSHAEDKDKIRYYYSESLFRAGKNREAALSFGELVKRENSEFGAKIRLRMGDCFRNLGDKKTAIAYYKLVVEKFPNAPESADAKKHIKKLESSS